MSFQQEGDALWRAVTDLGWSEEFPPHLAARVSILPSRVNEFLEMAGTFHAPPFRCGLVADVGTGLVRLFWWGDEAGTGDAGVVPGMLDRLRDWTRRCQGYLVVERCPLEVKRGIDVWGDPPYGLAIMRRIKQELDPAGILNPGRFLGGI